MEEALIGLLVDNILYYGVMIFGLVMAAAQLGINVGAALAGLGVVGLALAFAAQDSVANVISGIIIFWDKPFEVGDWIKVEEQFGRVNNITLRSTRIRTPRNTYVVIPNKSIIDAVLENLSQHGELRVDVAVGIAYKEDILAARRVLLEAVSGIDTVKSDPAPDVVVDRAGGFERQSASPGVDRRRQGPAGHLLQGDRGGKAGPRRGRYRDPVPAPSAVRRRRRGPGLGQGCGAALRSAPKLNRAPGSLALIRSDVQRRGGRPPSQPRR